MPVSKVRERVCQNCNKTYTLGVESTLHKYCSTECRRQWHYRKWKSNGGNRCPRKQKGYWLKNKYGITLDEYEDLLTVQNNKCAICGTPEPTGYNWHVDHCHKTGSVRGILCSKCNQALGLVNENIEILKSMEKYICKHNT